MRRILAALVFVALVPAASCKKEICAKGDIACLERHCEAKQMEDCLELAHVHLEATPPSDAQEAKGWEAAKKALAVDGIQARARETLACGEGKAQSCRVVALMFQNGEGVEKDETKATGYLASACDAGHAASCLKVARALLPVGTPQRGKDPSERYFAKACDLGSLDGCRGLAAGYYLQEDWPNTVAAYQKVCDKGDGESCSNLGQLYDGSSVVGVESDGLKAEQAYQKGCDVGHAPSCYSLGHMYEYGDPYVKRNPIRKDPQRAKKYLHSACDKGYKLACDSLSGK